MDTLKARGHDLPPDLLAEIDAVAAAEQRPAGEVLREAIERYLRERRSVEAFASGGRRTYTGKPEDASPSRRDEHR